MHSILRQSSNIARISRSSLQTAARASLRSTNHAPLSASIRAVQQARLYSNKQKPEKDNEVKNDGKELKDKKDVEPPSKTAPGTENLYDGQTPLSKKPEAGESSEPELAEGMVRMNPEDEKAMRELLDTLKMGLPKSQVEVIERAFENIQKEGMPKELRELMDDVRGKPMTLSSAAKLTRLASQMARKQAERDMDKDSKKTDFQSNDPKGSSGGFGGFGNMPPGGNKGGKQQQEGGFKVGEIISCVLVRLNWCLVKVLLLYRWRNRLCHFIGAFRWLSPSATPPHNNTYEDRDGTEEKAKATLQVIHK